MSKEYIDAAARRWSGRVYRNGSRLLLGCGLLMLALGGMEQARAEALPPHRIDFRVADAGISPNCTLQAHGSSSHGSLTLLLAIKVADHCIVIRTHYTTGRAS